MALRELLAEFGIEVDTEKLEHANEKVESFVGKIKKVAGAVGAAFAVKEIFEFAESTAHAIHAVEATAAALGISTEATQEFGYASKAAGMDAGELLNMMGRLQVAAANADKGEGGKAFTAIGVAVKDTTGHIKDADVLLEDVAEGIKRTEDPAKRAAAAVALFGRQGRQLLPFLVRGRDGIQKMRSEFAALGGGFDEDAIEKSAEFEHSMAKVQVVIDGIKGALVKGLFPVLGWIADKAAIVGGWFVRMTKNTNAARNALIMLGIVLIPLAWSIATALWAAFAPLLPAAIAIGAIYLLFDDLITMFEGGDSVIGEQIDKIFGKGSSAKLVQDVKDAWVEVKDAFRDMWPYVKQVYEAMKWIVENVVKGGIKVAGKVGDFLGDTLAQANNMFTEDQGVEKNKDTTTSNMIGLNAKALLEARQRGEDVSNFRVPNIPKGMTAQSALEATNAILPQVNRGDAGFTQYQSKYAQPAPQTPVAAGEVHVHVDGSTDMKGPELRKAVADGVNDARQKANRDAKHVLTQAGQKP